MARLSGLRHFWRSFTGHMIFGLLAIQILLTPALFYGILYFIERGFQSQFVDQVRSDTYLYTALVQSAVAHGNISNQKAILGEALFNEDLVLAEIVYPDGTVVKPDTPTRFADLNFKEDFNFSENGDQVYFIAKQIPIDIYGKSSASLRLGYNEKPTQNRIDVAYRYGILLVLGYLVASIFIAIFLGRRLGRPISRLQDIARRIATGNTDVDLNVSTSILEISDLTKDLDSMRQTLVDQNRDVRDREKKLNAIFDNAGEGIISIDASGVIVLFNHAAESMFGHVATDVLGRNVSLLMPVADRDRHDGYLENYLATGEANIIGSGREIRAQHKDGRLFPVYLTVSEIQLDAEHTFIGIVHDLTEEKQKEDQLLQSWHVVEQCPVSIVITDAMGVIEYVNPHFCRVTGYRPEEVRGEHTRMLNSGNTADEIYQELWTSISGGDIWRGEFQNRKKNGESFWESATICPVHDQSNEITHYLALKEDITEYRRKDLMLNQAMKLEAVGRMTDGIAHDFNNLLTIILGNLEFLQSDTRLDEDGETNELIADAMSAAYDGSNLIKQLLIFSRRKEPDSRPMEITTFMEGVQYLLKRAIPADIDLELKVAGDIGTVLIDSNRLESAVLNLVINARDAMPDGGRLTISVEKALLPESEEVEGGYLSPGDYIFIKVADNGSGMTEEVRRQALEPFYTTKPSAAGTGLGLSMVHDLMLKSEGGIRIESEPARGTTITLILPLYEQETESPAKHQGAMNQIPRGNETILVVEDRSRVRRYASRVLSGLGYTLIEAENAAEALDCLQTNDEIDLLFSDIAMPGGMNGRELARLVSSTNSSLTILLTTGMESGTDKGGKPEQDFPLLSKPYSPGQLARSVRSVLDTGQVTN